MHNTYLYIAEKYRHKHKIDIAQKFHFIDQSEDDVIGILVIGESARFDHFGINGYARNTTPHLSKTQNLFSFKAQATANLTFLSVPSMLTRAIDPTLRDAITENTFLSVLNKFGFHTSWIGTQSLVKYFNDNRTETLYEDVQISILPGGSALYGAHEYDGVILPYFDNLLTTHKKQFIVIHTMGSHWH